MQKEPKPREILIYETEDGKQPFQSWLNDLRDVKGRAIIRKRLNRVRLGNLGDTRGLGNGLYEFRIDFGPGYRIYFGEDGDKIVVLLIGGDKGTQEKDIQKARSYWEDYND